MGARENAKLARREDPPRGTSAACGTRSAGLSLTSHAVRRDYITPTIEASRSRASTLSIATSRHSVIRVLLPRLGAVCNASLSSHPDYF